MTGMHGSESASRHTLYDAETFPEFWDRYQELHANDESRLAHVAGTAAALGLLGLAIARRSWKLALAAPMIDSAIARLGHTTEARRETRDTWLLRPHWHLRAEWRLLRETFREYRRRQRIKRRFRREYDDEWI
jgi:hypothetical protein